MQDWPKTLSIVAVCTASLGGVWFTQDPQALWGLLAIVVIMNKW